jgi:glycosyltransferase involved in cell wall biosynthesis
MYVTPRVDPESYGGRQMLCRLNQDVLKEIYGDYFTLVELDRVRSPRLATVVGAISGHIDGLNRRRIAELLREIKAKRIETLFVDGSNLGALVRSVKTELPTVRVCTFFHNVEVRFFFGSLRQCRSPHALGVLLANYAAERNAVRFSDKIVTLCDSDSWLLRRIYGRSATHVAPIAVRDTLSGPQLPVKSPRPSPYGLFVGGGFYANRAGVAWFVKHVAPRIPIKTCIVGRGFDDMRAELERHGNVELVGEVGNLTPWYLGAHFVIAPIFDGSGMKTKIAEALMFGKQIVGTPHAFAGYDDIVKRAAYLCCSADDFVAAIESSCSRPPTLFDANIRAIYEEKYSIGAHKARLQAILSAWAAR